MGPGERLRSDQRGVVYAEFLMAFMPIFVLFLGVIQLCFIGASSLVVQNAAMKGARAAMVVLPDDPFFYEGEDVLTLDFDGTSDNSKVTDGLTKTLGDAGVDGPTEDESSGSIPGLSAEKYTDSKSGGDKTKSEAPEVAVGGPRLNLIRFATNVSLAPIAPPPQLLMAWMTDFANLDSLAKSVGVSMPKVGIRTGAIGTSPVARFFSGLLVYNSMAAAINFPKEPGSSELLNAEGGTVVYEPDDLVTVRITYLYPCTVPIVSRWICQSIYPGPDSWVSKVKRYSDEIASGGAKSKQFVRDGVNKVGDYGKDQLNGFEQDARNTINAPRDTVMKAAKCVKGTAKAFKDGIRDDASALRDGVVNDVKGLVSGLKSDALGLRDGVINDAKGLVNGVRGDVEGLGKGLVTDGKGLVGGLKGDARQGVRQLEAEAATLRDNLQNTGQGVVDGIGNDVGNLGQGIKQDGKDALGQVPGVGNFDNITGPADQTARAGKDVVNGGKELWGVGQDVYKLAQSPYDPFAAATTATTATDTVGRVVETTDEAGRRVVIGINETGQQVVKTYDEKLGRVEQTMTKSGELLVVTVDKAGNRVESTLDKAGNRIDRGIDQAGNQIIVAKDEAGKTITTTIDNAGNRVVETYDNAQGRVITTVDAVGNRTVTTFNAAGKRVDAAYTSATTRIDTTYDSLNGRTRTAYDGVTKRYESTVDEAGKCVENGYDSAEKLLDDPTKAFTDRANGIQEDVGKAVDKYGSLDAKGWTDEVLGGLRDLTPEEQALMDELHAGTKQPDMLDMLLAGDRARFYVLRREATLPLQSAPYRYPTYKNFEKKENGERADAK